MNALFAEAGGAVRHENPGRYSSHAREEGVKRQWHGSRVIKYEMGWGCCSMQQPHPISCTGHRATGSMWSSSWRPVEL